MFAGDFLDTFGFLLKTVFIRVFDVDEELKKLYLWTLVAKTRLTNEIIEYPLEIQQDVGGLIMKFSGFEDGVIKKRVNRMQVGFQDVEFVRMKVLKISVI
jgi:hypothetical protein